MSNSPPPPPATRHCLVIPVMELEKVSVILSSPRPTDIINSHRLGQPCRPTTTTTLLGLFGLCWLSGRPEVPIYPECSVIAYPVRRRTDAG